jgi:hypothetical protein
MYVLSSMPANRQSIAGSLFQTLSRLCTAVGYGIATAIFNAVQRNPSTSGYYANNPIEPFAACFWFSAGAAAIGILFVPWLRIGTQGHKGDTGRLAEEKQREKQDGYVRDEKGKEYQVGDEPIVTEKEFQ